MPQLHLLDSSTPEMRDLRITVSPPQPGRDHTQVVVSVERGNLDAPMPVWVGALPGLESDLLGTLVSEALSAWAYGETTRDVQRACHSVKRQATAHAAAHEF